MLALWLLNLGTASMPSFVEPRIYTPGGALDAAAPTDPATFPASVQAIYAGPDGILRLGILDVGWDVDPDVTDTVVAWDHVVKYKAAPAPPAP